MGDFSFCITRTLAMIAIASCLGCQTHGGGADAKSTVAATDLVRTRWRFLRYYKVIRQ